MDEMEKALQADGDKLIAITGRDHGPFTLEEAVLDKMLADTESASTITERRRCADIVQLARFGEIDTDFRTIIHFIEGGLSIEDVKKLGS